MPEKKEEAFFTRICKECHQNMLGVTCACKDLKSETVPLTWKRSFVLIHGFRICTVRGKLDVSIMKLTSSYVSIFKTTNLR